ncbi:MAG: hypothetical protein EWM73_00397 [Nitrospira sp.]|nr:MAG: hypothetical protein EWM73_00397 [Nitrospira sp.]
MAHSLSHLGHHRDAGTGQREPPKRVNLRRPGNDFPSHLLRQQRGITPQLYDERMKQRHIDVGTSLERADR